MRTDAAFLLRFLRAKKFDVERAYQLILKHYEVKCETKNKELFSNMRPSAVRHVLDDGVTGVLTQRDKFGRRVLIFRPGNLIGGGGGGHLDLPLSVCPSVCTYLNLEHNMFMYGSYVKMEDESLHFKKFSRLMVNLSFAEKNTGSV